MAYEDLHRAIDDAHILLETCWQEWQAKFGNAINNEMKWILSNVFSPLTKMTIQRDLEEIKREYFAYRMAIVQLTLGNHTEAPLLFSIGEMDDGEIFWVEVLEYFRQLSLTRQMILIIADPKLRRKLTGLGWSSIS